LQARIETAGDRLLGEGKAELERSGRTEHRREIDRSVA
jgi:hypothetical protein